MNNRYIPKPTNYFKAYIRSGQLKGRLAHQCPVLCETANENKNGTCFVQGFDIYAEVNGLGSPRTFKSWEWNFVKCRKDGVDC